MSKIDKIGLTVCSILCICGTIQGICDGNIEAIITFVALECFAIFMAYSDKL